MGKLASERLVKSLSQGSLKEELQGVRKEIASDNNAEEENEGEEPMEGQ